MPIAAMARPSAMSANAFTRFVTFLPRTPLQCKVVGAPKAVLGLAGRSVNFVEAPQHVSLPGRDCRLHHGSVMFVSTLLAPHARPAPAITGIALGFAGRRFEACTARE